MKIHYLLLSLSFIILVCNEPSNINSSADRGIPTKMPEKIPVYMEGKTSIKIDFRGTLPQSCPIGVNCDTLYTYHAYAGIIDSLHMYMSFKPQWLNNKTFKGVEDYFDYLYFSLHLPSRENDSVFYSYNQDAIWGSTVDSSSVFHSITGYSNDTITGILKVKFRNLTKTIHSKNPGCVSGDIVGVCSEALDEPKEYVIQYRIKLEE